MFHVKHPVVMRDITRDNIHITRDILRYITRYI